jgi:peptide/nickel transport system substrate-binding protein
METTYRLRPGLRWHDGVPLAAEDFVFSWQVYMTPELGYASSPPFLHVEEVRAPNPRSVVIRWNRPYFDAGTLDAGGGSSSRAFPPLPRHLLGDPFSEVTLDAFAAHPTWTTEYVGLGPYRLDRWEAGAFFEGSAFDGHALGRPKIERIRMLFISDFNTTVANMLAGDVHINVDDSLRFQQGLILKREWGPRNAGTVLVYPGLWRWVQIQQRPELANPQALRDVRVRKAMAHAVDKAAINEALFEGEGIMSETAIPSTVDYHALLDRAVVKYGHDVRRADQLMAEAGFARGQDGAFTSPMSGRFATDLAVLQSPANEAEMAIMGAGWRQAGFEIKEVVWPAVAARDAELRNTHAGLSATGGRNGDDALAEHSTPRIPSPQNRWTGSNRGGWVAPPEYDRLAESFSVTLDRDERIRMVIQMAAIFTENAVVIPLYFSPTITAFVAGLKGPQIPAAEAAMSWNVHEWEFR